MQAILKTAINVRFSRRSRMILTALIVRTALLGLFGVFIFFGILICTVMDSNAREPELQPLFNVGYKVIDLKYRKDGQEQTITVAVWYPTAAPSKSHHYGAVRCGKEGLRSYAGGERPTTDTLVQATAS
jgi:hypothetical protein